MPSLKTKSAGREIIYAKPRMKICMDKTAMTAKEAKKLLGWQEEPDDAGFGSEFDLKDANGVKIRCCNNLNNRQLNLGWVKTLVQEHLRKKWKLNFEPIIIGKTGIVLSGQHRLIAYILATQDFEIDAELYPDWNGECPVFETTVAFGAEETDEIVNTLDTGRPRSLTDVIFRSEYFRSLTKNERGVAARNLNYAVKFLWERTGVDDAFGLRRTHSESLDFIERHPKMVECVSHLCLEDDDKSIGKFISPGYASGLMFLMATSATDPQAYKDMDRPDETVLDDKLWEKAEQFWTLLGSEGKDLDPLRKAIKNLLEDEDATSVHNERIAIFVKAWTVFSAGKKMTAANIKPKYTKDDDGFRQLAENPTVGGIDFGGERESMLADEEEVEDEEADEVVEDVVESEDDTEDESDEAVVDDVEEDGADEESEESDEDSDE